MNEVARQAYPETASLRSKYSFSLSDSGGDTINGKAEHRTEGTSFLWKMLSSVLNTQNFKYKWINQVVIYYKQLESL